MGLYSKTACEGKKQFVSKALAERVALRASKHDRRTTYRCRNCGLWHIGSDSRLERSVIKNYKHIKRALRDGLDGFTNQSRKGVLG